jgi:hypothetical protein
MQCCSFENVNAERRTQKVHIYLNKIFLGFRYFLASELASQLSQRQNQSRLIPSVTRT